MEISSTEERSTYLLHAMMHQKLTVKKFYQNKNLGTNSVYFTHSNSFIHYSPHVTTRWCFA